MAVTPEVVANQFLETYYNCFRGERANLRSFYGPESVLSWEGKQYKGPQEISECFERMSKCKIDYVSITKEVQVAPGSTLLILVTGHIRIDDAEPIGFSQVFLLMPTPNQSWYIHNELFKFAFAG